MTRKYLGWLAVLLALALVAAACGDDEAEDTTTTTEAETTTTTEAETTTTTGAETTTTTEAETTTTTAAGVEPIFVCQVTDVGGIDDKSFNQTSYKGVEDAIAAGVATADSFFLESQDATDYVPNIQSCIGQGADLVVTVGFLLGDDTLNEATANPDTPFGIVDFAYDAPPDNLRGLVFSTDEAAFLAGYLAAGMTETGVLGTYGGINIPTVTIFMDGFVWGADYYNSVKGTDVTVIGWDPETQEGLFTGNFESTDDGRSFGQNLIDEGADIILPVAGPVGTGTAAVAQQVGNVAVIGVDADNFETDPTNSSVYLTSVLKGLDTAVFDTISQVASGTFSNELFVGTLSNDGVGLAPFHDFEDDVPAELAAEVEDLRQAIIDGTVTVGPVS